MGTSVATLFAAAEALFTGCDVATDLAGTLIGDFRWPLGGVDVFCVNRTTLFFFPTLFIGSFGAARLVTLRVFSNDLFTFPSVFLFGPRFALTRAPFLHLKHGLLQRFLLRGQRFPHDQSQCSLEVGPTVGIPPIFSIRLIGCSCDL